MIDVIHSILQYSWRDKNYIIFVRYLLGTAYLPSPMDIVAYHFFATLVPKPKETLYLDVKPDVASKRIVNRTENTREMFEEPEALQKMRLKGLALATLGKWQVIDGAGTPEEVELDMRSSMKLQ